MVILQQLVMTRRIAASLALIAFAMCLVMGIMAENPFATTLATGLKAMFGTFFIGLILGTMAQRMLEENLSDVGKKSDLDSTQTPPRDR